MSRKAVGNPFDIIREQLGNAVPFAKHAGVRLAHIEVGAAKAEIDQTMVSVNHIGTQHAGALFTLGETASGGAMAGLFADRILGVRPIAGEAQIRYLKLAKGRITAEAKVEGDFAEILARFDADRRVSFDVAVNMFDDARVEVATMRVSWTVKVAT